MKQALDGPAPIQESGRHHNRKQRVLPPTREQLTKHFVNAMVPMIGFGFMDNLIMIQAGELIDTSIGVTFGLSTLTAAAVGQIFSDMSGVCFGGLVGAVAGKFGLPSARLSHDQLRLGKVRTVGTTGRMVGILIGCLLGMTSLLFMDLKESQRLRRFKELQPILATIARHTKRALGVASCRIYLLGVDSEGHEALFQVGEIDGQPECSSMQLIGPIRGFSHHFNHKDANSTMEVSTSTGVWWRRPTPPVSKPPKIPLEVGPSLCLPASVDLLAASSYFRCIRIGSNGVSLPSSVESENVSNKEVEPIVKYVARTGQAVMCVRAQDESHSEAVANAALAAASNEHCDNRPLWTASDPSQLILSSTSPVSHALLCYPVFDDIDRERVIGVIELADKQALPGSPPGSVGVFNRLVDSFDSWLL